MFCADTPRPYIRLSPDVVCHLERFCHLKPFCHLVSPRHGATTRAPTHPPRVGGGGGSPPQDPPPRWPRLPQPPCPTHCIPHPLLLYIHYCTVKRTAFFLFFANVNRESADCRARVKCVHFSSTSIFMLQSADSLYSHGLTQKRKAKGYRSRSDPLESYITDKQPNSQYSKAASLSASTDTPISTSAMTSNGKGTSKRTLSQKEATTAPQMVHTGPLD
jgi:hypothetical protein